MFPLAVIHKEVEPPTKLSKREASQGFNFYRGVAGKEGVGGRELQFSHKE